MKKFKCNIAFLSVLTAVLPSCLSYVNIIDKEDPKFSYWTNLSICCLEGSTYRFSAPLTNVQDRVSEYGFCYQSESDSVEYVVAENSVENIYTADVTIEKNYGKTYYVDFVMHNGLGDKRSIASSEFTVNPLSSFVQFDSIITLSYDRQSKEAIVELACAVDEIVDVSAWGITYGKTQDLTQNITTIESTGDFNGKISATIPECLPGEIYYIRPYVKDGECYAYGKIDRLDILFLPIVYTNEPSDVISNSATLHGDVRDDGGTEVIRRGFFYTEGYISAYEDASWHTVNVGNGVGEYSRVLLLDPNRYYSYCAFAENERGMSYGEIKSFTTGVCLVQMTLPVVLDVTSTSLRISCTIVHDGGEAPSELGYFISENKISDINDAIKTQTDVSSFECELTGLKRNTVYYVMPYVINSAGISCGPEVDVRTLAELPTVQTCDVAQITDESALCGGLIVDDGDADITSSGIVWGMSENPTISGVGLIENSTALNYFETKLTGLLPNCLYYVRAYAVNSVGISYGENICFRTLQGLARISEGISIFNKTNNSVVGRFEIISDGGCKILEAGVYISEYDAPVNTGDKRCGTIQVGDKINVEIELTGLSRQKLYKMASYVINDIGEARSAGTISFSLLDDGNMEGYWGTDYEW